ncbi:polycystin-1-like protein 1 [Brachyistius frenatus]|uniref:polycystin-1-like protein 1 n=1 Tax=Brachyistius frenatus TaxID=100188 RepID=UPI0037E876E3
MLSCRVNVGTNATFLWSFGDGTTRTGQSTERHVFHRTGEFRVEVTVFNLVSSASLSSHIFVVDQPCRPPAVKNMGPLKLQVQRHEVIRLGVTYETEVDCDSSGGLNYTWTLRDSDGRVVPLPLTDTHKQSLSLQSHLLQYDTYTARARVQVVGSVVYSNYSVRVQVTPSPPVPFIQGGTNVFISSISNTTVTLDGQASYDPDFPMNPLSYSWTCKPVSSIPSSCFSHHIPSSSPVLTLPVSFLKHNFDQFQFTFTVHSGERSASSEAFLTVTSNTIRKVSVYCRDCQGDHVNWDKSFSVSAICEDCNIPVKHTQYSWSLYLVNVSSKPVTEVLFCYTSDLSAPSTIKEDPDTSPQIPGNTSHYTHTDYASTSSSFPENASETEAKELYLDLPYKSKHSTSPFVLDNGSFLDPDHFVQRDFISEFPFDPDSSADWEFSPPVLERGDVDGRLDPDYDVPFPSAEEGDPGMSAGRPTGVDDEGFSAGDDSVFNPAFHEDEGSNLVDPEPPVVLQEPTLLDLPRDSVDRGLFESFTYTGISSPSLGFRPFSLRPKSRYMVEVTVTSQNSFLGRTQLFLQTNPVPKGMTCQVQPEQGVELRTHFSVFCSSGREDLLYEYSYSVGGRPPRTLYHGRDFQYYFSLPSGDPSDDYKVIIYTEIRSGTHGSATKPCPVTVQVRPSFLRDTSSSSSSHHNPDLELSESGLRNLSALVQLGNSVEIRNYVSLLSGVLNRLSRDTAANTHAQRHVRNVLICTVCELESSEQESMADNIRILKDLLQVTSQVTLVSARQVTAHVQVVSELFSKSSAPDQYHGNQKTLNSLVSLLSYSLQAVTSYENTPRTHNSADITKAQESDSLTGENTRDVEDAPGGCLPEQLVPLVADILQTASDLMRKSLLFHETQEHRVSTDFITLYAARQNQTSTVMSSGSTTFYMPASLIQMLFAHHIPSHQQCVLKVLTELAHSPYSWASYPTQLSGQVVDLSLYKCSTRRKIPIRPLIQPISIELLHPHSKKSSTREYILLRSQVNYHSFNITHEHLQQAIQLTVVFTPPLNKAFPIMLLFRMFERPTPSMHHLQRIHHWESNTTRISLPPSHLNAAGVGHLALLNADFEKAPRGKRLSEQISYSLSVDSSLCLSWDGQQGAWTPHGCRTRQSETTSAVNCSCHQLRPLTVAQQQIQSSHDTADLDPFLSVSSDLTVLGVLVVFVCLYIPGLVLCKRAEMNGRVHYLSDNSPYDPHLYAVTIHTGLCSAARLSAKVYIMLHGEDGSSQTKELKVPGCTLFRRNSQDTFILSAADSLGPVWGVHLWHDNSGPSADWYLKQVEVSEVNRGNEKRWLCIGQCWLAVNKGDGRVERMLRVCTEGTGFAQMLCLKLPDYVADFHIWMSVYSCPCPTSFTHSQRLSVCVLLVLGYACVNTVIIAQTDDPLPSELGFVDMSAVSITTGLLSAVAVLPAATVISFLFRLRGDTDLLSVSSTIQEHKDTDNGAAVEPDVVTRKEGALESGVVPVPQTLMVVSKGSNADRAPQGKELLTESGRFRGTQNSGLSDTRDECQPAQKEKDPRRKCSSGRSFEEGSRHQTAWSGHSSGFGVIDKLREGRFRQASQRCHHVAWALCLLLSLCCLVLSAALGMRFSSSKVLLWVHSLFISVMSCIFLIHPAVILTVAVTVSCWYRRRPDFHSFLSIREFEVETSKLWNHTGADRPEEQLRPSALLQKRCSYLEERLRARQRERHLRLVSPQTPAELRKTRGKKRRETLIHKTLRNFSLWASMLFLLMCITYSNSFSDHYHLNRAVSRQFIRNHENDFMSIQKDDDWWKWTHTSLLDLLYKNASAKPEQSHILIGDPILQKMEISDTFQSQVSMVTLPRTCGQLGCYSGPSATVGLGHTKSDAASKLKLLHSAGWLGGQTVALEVQFTLYSPAPNLFTSVTLLTERSPVGVLLPSAKVLSVRVYHTPAVWDYVVMVCQLFFLFLSVLQLCYQVSNVGQEGLMGYWRTPSNWAEVSLLVVTLTYYICHVHHSTLVMEVVELLQSHNHRGRVDVSHLATWEQFIRTLRGIMLFLLTMKCVTVLRVNRTLDTAATVFAHALSSLLWPTMSGLILLAVLSCMRNLLYIESSWALWTHCWGLKATGRLLLLPGHDFLYCGALYLSSTVVLTAVVMGAVSSLVRSGKRSQSRRNVFTSAELAGYIRERVSEFTGQHRPAWIDKHVEGRTYYLEEFESLVDELLLRLDTFSDSLHHTLPPEAHRYREEDGPDASPAPQSSSMSTQDSVRPQTMMNNPADVGDHCLSNYGDTPLASHQFRSQVELEILQVLHQRGQTRHSLLSDIAGPSDYKLSSKNCLSCPESTSLKSFPKECVPVKQAGQWTETNDGCWLSKTQATHAEVVVVEVLVHEELERVEPDTQ